MATGICKWWSRERGYGFLENSDGSGDVFAHFSSIAGEGYRNLVEGQRCTFDVVDGVKGPQASNVRPDLASEEEAAWKSRPEPSGVPAEA